VINPSHAIRQSPKGIDLRGLAMNRDTPIIYSWAGRSMSSAIA